MSDVDHLLHEIIESIQTIAVMGMSRDPSKAAHTVPLYLRDQGYEIMPVNPNYEAVAGVVTVSTGPAGSGSSPVPASDEDRISPVHSLGPGASAEVSPGGSDALGLSSPLAAPAWGAT